MNESKKSLLLLLSGILGFLVAVGFAVDIAMQRVGPQNIATWSMVLALDFIGVVLAFRAGNRKPWLQVGWAMAATLIVAAILFRQHVWEWGWIETASALAFLLALCLWWWKSAAHGLGAYMLAMYISCIPQGIDYWNTPQPETAYVWLGSAFASFLAVAGAPKHDYAHVFVPWAAIILNVGFTILVLR